MLALPPGTRSSSRSTAPGFSDADLEAYRPAVEKT